MEPITVTIIAGASALSALTGVVIGRLSKPPESLADSHPEPALLPPVNEDTQRLRELEQRHDALRDALSLPDDQAEASGPLSSLLDRFELSLRELRALKFTRAAAIFDARGLMLLGHGGADDLGALGALAGALSSFGFEGELDALEWSSELGVHLRVERVALGGGRDVLMATRTDGAPATSSALVLARAHIGGEVRAKLARDVRARLLVREDVPAAVAEMASELPLTELTIARGGEVEVTLGEPSDEPERQARAEIWRWASALGAARDGLGALHTLHLSRGATRLSGYAAQHADAASASTLWLTMPAAAPSPDARIDGWLGQLRWQLSDPSPSTPSPDVRHPEGSRGARP